MFELRKDEGHECSTYYFLYPKFEVFYSIREIGSVRNKMHFRKS